MRLTLLFAYYCVLDLHIAEEPLQDGHAGYYGLPQDVPAAAVGHAQEPDVHPDSAYGNRRLVVLLSQAGELPVLVYVNSGMLNSS